MTSPDPRPHFYVLLDRSGSMESMRGDVIGGFNNLLADQQADGPDARLTLVQFDSQAQDKAALDKKAEYEDLVQQIIQKRAEHDAARVGVLVVDADRDLQLSDSRSRAAAGATMPKWRYAESVAMRPRGVRCK